MNRIIHFDPLRAGIVNDLGGLNDYPRLKIVLSDYRRSDGVFRSGSGAFSRNITSEANRVAGLKGLPDHYLVDRVMLSSSCLPWKGERSKV